MKIYKWLGDPMSGILGYAVVEVEPREAADIEQMLILLDGNSVGHFGIRAMLVSCPDPPEIYRPKKGGHPQVRQQFGFQSAGGLRKQTRYYSVHVSRD